MPALRVVSMLDAPDEAGREVSKSLWRGLEEGGSAERPGSLACVLRSYSGGI